MLSGGGCALVYCRSCAEAERVCDGLVDLGLAAAFYHAQVEPAVKERVQEEWQEGHVQVVVATCAFGMGVHKADVRYVVHWTLPESMLALSQAQTWLITMQTWLIAMKTWLITMQTWLIAMQTWLMTMHTDLIVWRRVRRAAGVGARGPRRPPCALCATLLVPRQGARRGDAPTQQLRAQPTRAAREARTPPSRRRYV